MLKRVFVSAMLAAGLGIILPVPAQACNVTVSSPESGSLVKAREYVQGKTNLVNRTIWVVVHPLAVASYWVQQPASVDSDGKWVLQAAFGEPGQHQGAKFEMKAFGEPANRLKVGKVLKAWPKADCGSSIVRVTRK